ncbi:MAG: NAD(P)H-binding protein [Anaerolineales bacterium]
MPASPSTIAVTGAFSYTGQYIAREFLKKGHQVTTLTRRPDRQHPLQGQISALPLDFSQPAQLVEYLRGSEVLVNTYWVRYNYPGSSFEQAVENTHILVSSAIQARVRRLVHISVSQPDSQSDLPYFRGKQRVEDLIIASGLSYSILRPTIIFGDEEVLINNITWLLRRFPVFPIPGDGRYRVQPVFVQDLARLVTKAARENSNEVVDVGGPEVFTFRDLLLFLKRNSGSRTLLVSVSPWVALFLSKAVSTLLGDIMLTKDELTALMQERLIAGNPGECNTRFTDWARQNASNLGKHYVNELRRHHGVN